MATRRQHSSAARVARVLRNKGPKLVENTKRLLGMKGLSCSSEAASVVRDLLSLKKPNSLFLPRLNAILPFEDVSSLEFLAEKNDASLVLIASHSKKRPHNIVMGRLFDFKVLDLVELGVTGYTATSDVKCESKKSVGSKPCFLFSGDWEADPRLATLKNLFLDMFRGVVVTEVALPALDHVIALTVVGTTVYFRTYSIHLKKSGGKVPRVELESCGPNINFEVRRTQLASDELARAARRMPKVLDPVKVKNVSYDGIGTKEGRIHMERQNYDKLQTRKLKALKILKKRKKLEASGGGSGGDATDGVDGESGEAGVVTRTKRARKHE